MSDETRFSIVPANFDALPACCALDATATEASFVVAITESLGALFMPGSTAPVLPFVLFILVLLFKPEGLFGARAR